MHPTPSFLAHIARDDFCLPSLMKQVAFNPSNMASHAPSRFYRLLAWSTLPLCSFFHFCSIPTSKGRIRGPSPLYLLFSSFSGFSTTQHIARTQVRSTHNDHAYTFTHTYTPNITAIHLQPWSTIRPIQHPGGYAFCFNLRQKHSKTQHYGEHKQNAVWLDGQLALDTLRHSIILRSSEVLCLPRFIIRQTRFLEYTDMTHVVMGGGGTATELSANSGC